MNHKVYFYIFLIFFISSCSVNRQYVRVEKPSSGRGPDGSYEIDGQRYYPISSSSGFVELGEASWYGDDFHGRKTANGEVYDMHSKSAAHKVLPFNTYVKVENLGNKKYTIVRINDRGPFKKGRIIDLSYAAAKEIDLVGPGVAKVKVTALRKDQVDPNIKEGTFTVQVGSFGEQANAQRLADKLRVLYDYINITEFRDVNNKKFFRLHVSKTYTLDSAARIEKKLKDMGFTEAFIVRL
ncbi:MAG: septal ring lytic transglycosylase RlpA family protein [Deltaproteobacteria bacterium]|nr:septal ring lytic transglycosylase RlpA family protein [Deltaproteobacteria bacterium]